MAELIITIRVGHDVHAVAAQLAKVGLQVQQELEAIGSVTGSADDKDIPRLQSIPGVADVCRSVPIQLNPPGTPS